MAEQSEKNPAPLIAVGIIIVLAIGYYMIKMRRKPTQPTQPLPELPSKDPCEGLPDWACATVSILNPLAKTSVDVFKAKADSDIELARIKSSR